MKIAFKCSCGADWKVDASMAGMKVKCNKCNKIMVVPAEDGAEAAPPPPRAPRATGAPAGPARERPDPPSTALARAPVGGSALAMPQQLDAIHMLVERGRHIEAMQALKAIAPESGDHPAHAYLIGLAFIGMGNFPNALDSLNRAIDGGMSDHNIYAAKGRAELALGQHAAAVSSMDQALTLAGTDVPDYMALLAKAYDGAGMKADAGATWKALTQINPTHAALAERNLEREKKMSRKQDRDVQQAMLQMQREQRASDTACWICIVLRCLLECI